MQTTKRPKIAALVIGGGPAGLMAAQELALAGHSVLLAEAMPTVGRKFLMAGKSGLNLTKDEPLVDFAAHFTPKNATMAAAVDDFGPAQVTQWAQSLGQEVFTGSSGRVFPTVMKASPLLRAWIARLTDLGVRIETRWRWTGWRDQTATFDTPDGPREVDAGVTVLALGGASWARLGSDGGWAALLPDQTAPFKPANMGFTVPWSSHMAAHFGRPVKTCALVAGTRRERGEFVISARGIEGGGVYAIAVDVRDGAPLSLDLLPDVELAEVRRRLDRPRGKATLANHLRKVLRLDPLRWALLNEFGRPLPEDLAPLLKRLPVRHTGPRPMDEAISTAGGIRFDALTDELMLRDRPGVFCAGEMLDWEAPTGGYLITGCLASGRLAGRAAAAWSAARRG